MRWSAVAHGGAPRYGKVGKKNLRRKHPKGGERSLRDFSAVAEGICNFNVRLMEMAQLNTVAALDFAREMSTCTNPSALQVRCPNEISAALTAAGYVNERGAPFAAMSVRNTDQRHAEAFKMIVTGELHGEVAGEPIGARIRRMTM